MIPAIVALAFRCHERCQSLRRGPLQLQPYDLASVMALKKLSETVQSLERVHGATRSFVRHEIDMCKLVDGQAPLGVRRMTNRKVEEIVIVLKSASIKPLLQILARKVAGQTIQKPGSSSAPPAGRLRLQRLRSFLYDYEIGNPTMQSRCRYTPSKKHPTMKSEGAPRMVAAPSASQNNGRSF